MKDQFVECEMCGSKLCYKQLFSDTEYSQTCFSCGITTNTHIVLDSEVDKTALKTTPELYKNLRRVGKDNLVWYPATISIPEKGMVFLDGTTRVDIGWTSVKFTPITETEKSRFPADQTHRLDMSTAVKFTKDQFAEALNSIGFFQG